VAIPSFFHFLSFAPTVCLPTQRTVAPARLFTSGFFPVLPHQHFQGPPKLALSSPPFPLWYNVLLSHFGFSVCLSAFFSRLTSLSRSDLPFPQHPLPFLGLPSRPISPFPVAFGSPAFPFYCETGNLNFWPSDKDAAFSCPFETSSSLCLVPEPYSCSPFDPAPLLGFAWFFVWLWPYATFCSNRVDVCSFSLPCSARFCKFPFSVALRSCGPEAPSPGYGMAFFIRINFLPRCCDSSMFDHG